MKDFLQCKTMEYCREDLDGLRTREIKKLLLEQLGASYQSVSKILDRKELKILALELILKQRKSIAFNNILNMAFYAIISIFFLIIIFLFRRTIYSSTFSVSYNIHKRVETLRIAIKERFLMVIVLLLIGFALQIFINMLQIYTLCTWILPSHILSRFSLPMISFPLSLNPSSSSFHRFTKGTINNQNNKENFNHVSNNPFSTHHQQSHSYNTEDDNHSKHRIPNTSSSYTSSYTSSQFNTQNTSDSHGGSSYSMDIGPMITMYLCQFIQQKIEIYATKHLLQQVERTNEKKEEKRQSKRFSSNNSDNSVMMTTKRHSSDFWEHTIYVDDNNDDSNDNHNANDDSNDNNNDNNAENSNNINENNDSNDINADDSNYSNE